MTPPLRQTVVNLHPRENQLFFSATIFSKKVSLVVRAFTELDSQTKRKTNARLQKRETISPLFLLIGPIQKGKQPYLVRSSKVSEGRKFPFHHEKKKLLSKVHKAGRTDVKKNPPTDRFCGCARFSLSLGKVSLNGFDF